MAVHAGRAGARSRRARARAAASSAWLEPDHPGASAATDLAFVDRALRAARSAAAPDAARARRRPARPTLFSARPLLRVAELDAAELETRFAGDRHASEEATAVLLSFFGADGAHVVLPAKERASLRPHGQILRTGDTLVPDEASLTTTVWMGGVFHSMVTQGHVSINRFLSTTHGVSRPVPLARPAHVRRARRRVAAARRAVGVRDDAAAARAGSIVTTGGLLEVRSWAAVDRHELWLDGRTCCRARRAAS